MVMLAFFVVSGRQLKVIHFSVIQFHYSFWGVIMALGLLFFEEKPKHRKFLVYDSKETYALLLLMGFTSTAGLYLFVFSS